ncbi:MAG: NAD(P)-binding protein [Parasporobacterium sp.]|nr:NAD(P)-binding protein [Parasporobacterium sp.]
MLRISQIRLKINHNRQDLINAVSKKLRVNTAGLLEFIIIKKSIDARDPGNIMYVYTVDVTVQNEEYILKRCRNSHVSISDTKIYDFPPTGSMPLEHRPVVIGSGPAGLFCAYFLAEAGFCPLLIERGQCVEERKKTVEAFWNTGVLDSESNVQFGEGGAGTFSDGKLNTGVNDPLGRNRLVLETFVKNGAPEEILYAGKPHIGTDILAIVVKNMRQHIISLGGEVRFNTCFREFISVDGKIKGIIVNAEEFIPAEAVVLAIGHSARDTFSYIIGKSGLAVTAKPFAVGVRAEHTQEMINESQYGEYACLLPPADYKLTYRSSAGTSVYSFCMCPGGYVVNSSSEEGYTCVNGMSYSGRSSDNANAAIVAAVRPSDDPAENIAFQQELEHRTYIEGGGLIVSQTLGDFESGNVSESFNRLRPVHKGGTSYGNIRNILPESICNDIIEAMHAFGRKIKGFDDPDVILSAVESRTSSPVRIERNESLQASVSGIYPAGEGAGYAGGITSAAIDGIKVFEKICTQYMPLQ